LSLERHGDWTLGTHITFRNRGKYWGGKEHKTNEYEVVEKHNVRNGLGNIFWLARWRKYVFEPNPRTVYEETCMREISQFIEEETASHRAAVKNKKMSAVAAR